MSSELSPWNVAGRQVGTKITLSSNRNLRGDPAVKTRFAFLAVCIQLFATFAVAQTVYENGPKNDQSTSWAFTGSRFFVSDSFAVSGSTATINGISIWVVIFPTDHDP